MYVCVHSTVKTTQFILHTMYVLEFRLAASVPELVRHIPSLFMMFLLKVAGDSWVSGTANSSSLLYRLLLLSILSVCVYK